MLKSSGNHHSIAYANWINFYCLVKLMIEIAYKYEIIYKKKIKKKINSCRNSHIVHVEIAIHAVSFIYVNLHIYFQSLLLMQFYSNQSKLKF